ncbi:MAG: hypothetical protein PHC41_11990 [Lachnospiraceae bacterium]|nr:hypothetical protein [Lachnospiraceae bacterium]MDD3616929.1 hypothetical protein [Lachnospiraceae bacterium]
MRKFVKGILFAAGILGTSCLGYAFGGQIIKTEAQDIQSYTGEYAGDYVRGSLEYRQYMKYAEEHAQNVEHTEGNTIYMLDEEAVLEWGQPSNEYKISVQKSDLLDKLMECGYKFHLTDEKGEYSVTESPYGVITTSFRKYETYDVDDTLNMRLLYDPVSKEIYMCYVYSDEKSDADYTNLALDTLESVGVDFDVEKSVFGEKFRQDKEKVELHTLENNSSFITGYVYDEACAIFFVNEDLGGQAVCAIGADFPALKELGAAYYWPQN